MFINFVKENIMLNKYGLLGFIIGLVLFAIFIRVCMSGSNFIGNTFRKFIKYLINLFSNGKPPA
jgi:hypothetical protein